MKLAAVMGALMTVLTGLFLYYAVVATPPSTYGSPAVAVAAPVSHQQGPVSNLRMR